MSKIRDGLSLIGLTLLMSTTPVWGAPVLETVELQASGFHDYLRDAVYPLPATDTTFSFIYNDTAGQTPATPLGYDLGFPAPFGENLKYAVDRGSFIPGSIQNELTIGQYADPGGLVNFPGTIGIQLIIGIPYNDFNDAFYVTFDDNQFTPDFVNLTFTSTPLYAVPEPATWAMIFVGLGLVGAAMRRRRASFGDA